MNRKISPRNLKEIYADAALVREQYGIGEDEVFPICDFLFDLSEQGKLTVQVLENDDPLFEQNVCACYNLFDNFIYIKDQTLEDIDNGDYRSNFTLAHEFYHYYQLKVLQLDVEETDEEVPPFMEPEWQANNFAGELLCPEKYLDLPFEELAKKFHVSEECALTRKAQKKKREERKKQNALIN